MTTTNFYGIPSEGELEQLANSLFPDLDVQRCATGIENLAASGDTSVIYDAAAKAENYLGGYGGYYSEYEQLAAELTNGASGYEQLANELTNGYSGYEAQAEQYAQPAQYQQYTQPAQATQYAQPAKPAQSGYSPAVLSETQAASYAPKTVQQAAAPVSASNNAVVGTKTLDQIRADFPILKEVINGHPLVWLDNGATTQRPQQVIDRLSYYYTHENSNVHRGAHELAARSTDAYENARQITADFIGAPDKNNIVFVRGTTEGINLAANAYVKPLLQPGDEIILSILEHHANIVPWQLVAEETGALIKVIPCDESGQLILSEYEKLFTRRTKFVSVTQVSNVLGTVTPVEEIIAIAHAHGVRILIDGAQSVAHIPVNVSALDADFFVFSGHKIFAPTGIGALYGKPELLEAARPYHGGGNMIKDVTFERTIYNPAPNKFEAGTGSIADAVGLGAALEYLNAIGMPAVNKHEHELLVYAMSEMRRIPGLHLIGNATNKAGVLSFVMDGRDIFAIGEYLNKFGIAVRSGHHCAQPVLRHYGLEGTVRPTLAVYNSPEDVDALVKALWSLVQA